jgi:hypothetical protein
MHHICSELSSRRGDPHQEFRIGLVREVHLAERTEAHLLVGADRREVMDGWADHTDVYTVERERDIAQELTKHRGSVTETDELVLADEEVDPDRVLAERESIGIFRIVADPVVLEHPGGSPVDMREVVVRRISPLDRFAVFLDGRIWIRHLHAVVPPASYVRLEEPSPDDGEVLLAQGRERVPRANSTSAEGRRRRPGARAST